MNTHFKPYQRVTFKEIVEAILPDSPYLEIDTGMVVQESHVPDLAILLESESWTNSIWTYIQTTEEWIPVFKLHSGDVSAMVDIKKEVHGFGTLVTPKSFPLDE